MMSLRIASDCEFIAHSQHSNYDYSSYQALFFSSLTLTKLHKETGWSLYAAKSYECSSDGTVHTFTLSDEYLWSNGSQILGSDYHRAIELIRKDKKNPLYFHLQSIVSIQSEEKSITIKLHSTNYQIPILLTDINLSPIKGENYKISISAGSYVLEEINNRRIILTRNQYNRKMFSELPDKLEFGVESSRYQALKRFYDMELDVTCDTSFPYEDLDKSKQSPFFNATWPGLLVILNFEGQLTSKKNESLRKRLKKSINKSKILEKLFHGVRVVESVITPWEVEKSEFCDQIENIDDELSTDNLVLAYDDFYPNREICEEIALDFQALGIQIDLKKDDYNESKIKSDLRLQINFMPPGSFYRTFRSLLVHSVLRNSKSDWYELAKIIRDFEVKINPNQKEKKQFVKNAQSVLDSCIPFIPLFEMPGIAMQRIPFYQFYKS